VPASAFLASPLTGLFMSRAQSRGGPFSCKAVLVLWELALFNSRIEQERE
jgi:hypothetical protein